jgi:hypothetical protein
MQQTHVAGERLFVDYAGATLEVIDAITGKVRTAQPFVAALGAPSYTYADASFTQNLADWIGSHTRAFAFYGGVPAMVVSDNLKSGITKACFYEPAVNRSYGRHRRNAHVEPGRLYTQRGIVKVLGKFSDGGGPGSRNNHQTRVAHQTLPVPFQPPLSIAALSKPNRRLGPLKTGRSKPARAARIHGAISHWSRRDH